MEIWGRCETCERWFYCEAARSCEQDWSCPVCRSEPVAIENRGDRGHIVRVDRESAA
jgi:Zn finger protein HypA/HybF involved in hydrogenase expression